MAKKLAQKKESYDGTRSELGKLDGGAITASSVYDIEDINTKGLRNIGNFTEKTEQVIKSGGEVKEFDIQKTNAGFLIKGNDITEGDVLNAVKSEPLIPRSPKILALKKDISDKDAEKVLIDVNNAIINNNKINGRSDSLNIITVPEEEFIRRALISSVEDEIFGSFGKEGSVGKRINIEKQSKIIRQYDDLIVNVPKEINDKEIEIRNDEKSLAKLRIDKTTQKKTLEAMELGIQSKKDEIIRLKDTLSHADDVINKLSLPKQITVSHPYEKERDENGKSAAKKILIKDLSYGVLHDVGKKSLYGPDEGRFIINGGKAVISMSDDEEENIEIDLGNEIDFTCGDVKGSDADKKECARGVKSLIQEFQSEQVDLRRPNYSELDSSGAGTTRIGTESRAYPNLLEDFNAIYNVKENKAIARLIKEDPRVMVRLERFKAQLEEYEKAKERTPDTQCENGKVLVRRKRSSEAWGMTPKQAECTMDIAETRNGLFEAEIERQRVIVEEDFNKKGKKNYSNAERDAEAEKRAEDVLNKDPEYRKYVGCNTEEDIEKIEQYNNDYDEYKDDLASWKILKSEDAETQEPKPTPPEKFKIPMRFPTKNAMGDTTYCKSYRNTKPNVSYSFVETQKIPTAAEIETLRKRKEVFDYLDQPAPKEIADELKRAEMLIKNPAIAKVRLVKPKIIFKEGTGRKKNTMLLKRDQ